jgi:hypothetical protein
MPLKITTWNVKHTRKLIDNNPSANVLDRRSRVRETIEAIDPDILCLVEGPLGEQEVTDFCAQVLANQWQPALLGNANAVVGQRDDDYETRGTQWIWFLVRQSLAAQARLQAPAAWQAFVGGQSWPVNYWGIEKTTRHSHYRHPQVLIYDIGGGHELEMIGVHLKSKINRKQINRDAEGNLIGDYVDEALKARIKLATEAHDVRAYINAKFDQLPAPGLLVLGDCNDGPGRDFFERQYLFFDLISNLQGEVLLAERFFNHALFDFPGHLRWSARFRDDVEDIRASQNPLLLDHILISQPLCGGQLPLIANPQAGQVEHEDFERFNAGSNSKTRSSDHRPVSLTLTDTGNP